MMEVPMATKVRINLANPQELLELPGLSLQQAEAIVKFRAQHGPIRDAPELASILGARTVSEALWERTDFSPAEATAPEAPGA
jgi:DNA uptake protein ComE-like DNA-binding protein